MDCSQAEKEATRDVESVPYIVHEGIMARSERIIKRLIIALLVVVVLLFASNMSWLHYISNCDIQTYEYTQDGEGVNLVGDGNGVTYNEPTGKSAGNPEEE